MHTANLIYIRESNGLSYQQTYNPNQLVSNLLSSIFKKQVSTKLRALSKGRLLEMNQTLQNNNLKPNQIIHLLTLSREEKDGGDIYLSFDNKIYRIHFNIQETVRQLKDRIGQETGVQADVQIILFNSIQLENTKYLKDYELRNGDFLCMAEIAAVKPHILDVHHVIFPKKNLQKRRGSQCIHNYEETGADTSERRQKLFSSVQNILSHSSQSKSIRLSDNNSSDQIRLPETISEQFIQQANYTQQNSKLQNQQVDNRLIGLTERQKGLASNLTLFPDLAEKVGLCESYHYEGQDAEETNHEPVLAKEQKQAYFPVKINPRIVNSVQIQSPIAQPDGQAKQFSI